MDDAFWVFAYGSLMWKPGFKPAETQPATVYGYHRAMCVISHRYRGTSEVPGMVLGLDRGGSCRGLALRIAKTRAAAVLAYLHEREMTGGVYHQRILAARLDDGRVVRAHAFVACRDHPQYAGRMDPAKAAALIRKGVGIHGTARDYLANTVAHLDEMSLSEPGLRRLLDLVDAPAKARR